MKVSHVQTKPSILASDQRKSGGGRIQYIQKTRPVTQLNCKEQIKELQKTIEKLEKKLKDLRYTQKKYDHAMTNGELRRALYTDLQNEINRFSERLQKRADMLNNFQEEINTFRQYTDDLPPIPKERLTSYLSNSKNPQTKLLNENKVLINQALAQERTMLILKMRMRLCHDHRDLDQLRSVLNKMMGGGKDIDEDQLIIKKYKEVISRLKLHIRQEKARIEEVSKPYNVEYESAVIIQKTWRGYIFRKRKKEGLIPNPTPTPPNENDADNAASEEVTPRGEEANPEQQPNAGTT